MCRLTQLQDLTLACCKLSSAGVGSLCDKNSMTCLDLVGCVDGVTPDAMQVLVAVSCWQEDLLLQPSHAK